MVLRKACRSVNPRRCWPGQAALRLLALLLALLSLALALQYLLGRRGLWRPRPTPRIISPRGDLAEDEKTTIELFRTASPSVVNVVNLNVRRDWFSRNLFEIPQGTGSGLIWDAGGHVVTNFHVVEGGETWQVTLADQTSWRARLAGAAPDQDLAVLAIDAPAGLLQPISIGTSSDLQVGQKVFAIGNPFGLDLSLTTGIISGLGREILSPSGRRIRNMIQTDAAINPGNSGGPLLDSAGRLIGINSAIVSPSGVYAGIGFAVPVDTIQEIVPQLIEHGKIVRPGLGVILEADEVVARLGRQGALIREVIPGSAAEAAGLLPVRRDPATGRFLPGDLIIAVEGVPVGEASDLIEALRARRVGETVGLTVVRQDSQLEISVTLQGLD